MAAHTLTIINQTLGEGIPITEKTCEQIEHACSYARGMDIPCISSEDWDLVNAAAKTRLPDMLKVALQNVRPRVAYQEAYRNAEHLARAQALYVAYETDGWMERSNAWPTLPSETHRDLAKKTDDRVPAQPAEAAP
jgi:hypothetical protein